jgi:hypothetical protein
VRICTIQWKRKEHWRNLKNDREKEKGRCNGKRERKVSVWPLSCIVQEVNVELFSFFFHPLPLSLFCFILFHCCYWRDFSFHFFQLKFKFLRIIKFK